MLLDECMPRPIRDEFIGHDVSTIEEASFKSLKNGELLRAASKDYDVLVTVDKNIEFQQSLKGVDIAVLVFDARSNKLERLLPLIPDALEALKDISVGDIVHISI